MNNNENVSATESQKKRLMAFFKTGQKITSLEALNDLGIYRLSARLSELENIGVPISRERLQVVNRYGEQIRIKRYWIEPYRRAAELKKLINNQPRVRVFHPTAYDRAEQAKIELDALIKNNPNLFSECNK